MLSKNFKFLYRYYKDKQVVLASMLDVSQSTISDYINGNKDIPIDKLQKISVRYNVSMDDLMTKDLSLEFDSPQTLTVDDAAHFSEKMFPILTSNIAKANENFNIAHDILLQSLWLDKIDGFCGKIVELERAIALFQKAWDESNTYVALTNSLYFTRSSASGRTEKIAHSSEPVNCGYSIGRLMMWHSSLKETSSV